MGVYLLWDVTTIVNAELVFAISQRCAFLLGLCFFVPRMTSMEHVDILLSYITFTFIGPGEGLEFR